MSYELSHLLAKMYKLKASLDLFSKFWALHTFWIQRLKKKMHPLFKPTIKQNDPRCKLSMVRVSCKASEASDLAFAKHVYSLSVTLTSYPTNNDR